MKATIEKVSRFGVMIDGDWKNLSKFHKVSLDDFSAGDEVEIELQKDKYITSLEHLGETNGNGSGAAKETDNHGTDNKAQLPARQTADSDRQTVITRQSAYNAVLGSPWLGEFYKSMDYSQAVSEAMTLIDRLSLYAQKGNPSNN